MNTAIANMRTQLLHAITHACSDPAGWKLTEALTMAVCAQISFDSHGTAEPFEYADPLKITILEVKMALRGRPDVTFGQVERVFWELCPSWLARQLGAPPVQKAAGAGEIPLLGLATTKQLLEEIAARGRREVYYAELGAEMQMGAQSLIGKLPGSMLEYRTAGDSASENR